MRETDDRCRLVLILPPTEDIEKQAQQLEEALGAGDVATVILPQYGRDDQQFQIAAEHIVPIAQAHGAAALIAGDSRTAGRSKADGLHFEGSIEDLRDTLAKHTPKMIVGAGGASERHKALEIGEAQPDYIFFGKIEGDIKPEPHPKNLALAEWWASMVEIPCIVMGGNEVASVVAAAETGAEFVALRLAVFEHPEGPAAAIATANALLDEKAPRFNA
ncbi:MAG: thiamine phosphate synthase [Alphaproteobacteria bacterium]|uniref:Thiamine-phosphate pyrophosphorylase n=1 Tax=Pseudorhizobium pelagicum TaxID=1509405 RepID=A0A922P269_9HYPH|nr:thiamine phosphate synthase [Pseudorhizobium pelagicum]MBA4784786.1 thiamine phosphate synthase [Hyphomicrobiales bacterium]MBU1316689.1 thiamine phosphate synthase [Alphaproteobacteria bacterium]KEQ06583.1 thiamine-phosphate pyrophosphorylase [Pseudorhizobium pelagicum]KEQ09739.1 thiamine-phosphate pyrophosphorylase [Pseudorhizobium pelagicum]MBU1548392.1 thiamine phosphate synthase [Alphaproteobacteria bacterium]